MPGVSSTEAAPKMPPIRVLLLIEEGSALCAQAQELLDRLTSEYSLVVATRDLALPAARDLARGAGLHDAPVVFVEGRPFSAGPLSEADLRPELERHAGEQGPAPKVPGPRRPEPGTRTNSGGGSRRDAPARRRVTPRRMVALAAAVAFVALLTYGLVAKAPDDTIDEALADGTPAAAPAFELPVLQEGELPGRLARRLAPALEDGEVALSELRGTPVVLNFWASWCVPCREEAPVLARSWRRYGPRGVAFVGLNMQDLTDDAREFMREFDNDYLNVRDPTDGVAREWGVLGIPETFFVSRGGEVVGHVIGVVDGRQMSEGVAAARSGRVFGSLSGGEQRPTR